MILNAMTSIRDELNQFLIRRTKKEDLDAEMVVLSELVNLDGSVAYSGQNKILCTLISVEQDRSTLNYSPGGLQRKNPPINLNLYVLFSAYFQANNYQEAIKSLSNIIGFFQGKQVFSSQNTPGLKYDIDKISVELVSLDVKELSNFWTAVGSKHLPSVLYKWRMLSITEDFLLEELPEVTGLENRPEAKRT